MVRILLTLGLLPGFAGCALAAGVAGVPSESVDFSQSAVDPQTAKANCVKLWKDMSVEERAKVWPMLDGVSRAMDWSCMSPEERRELREHLSESDRQALRNRYSISMEEMKAPVHGSKDITNKFCAKERTMLRQQIIEVHMELHEEGAARASHTAGEAQQH